MNTVRMVVGGWLTHLKILSRSGFYLLTSAVQPVVFASIAFFMFRDGERPGSLLYAAIGAGLLGMWSTTLSGSGNAITRLRHERVLELLVAAPAPLAATLLSVTLATASVGLYAVVATLAWGRLLFGISIRIEHPVLFAASVPATVLGLGAVGLLIASLFVLYRHANALANLFEYPGWLLAGLLVPIGILPPWVRPLSMVWPPTWGAEALRASALGGDAPTAIGLCVALSAGYLGAGVLAVRRFETLARRHASLDLA